MFREPLIIPLAGFAAGILLSHCTRFHAGELAICLSAFATFAIVAFRRRERCLAMAAMALAMVAAGALVDVLHRPGPAPRLDAEDGEVLTVAGCVVQSPVLTVDREHFVLELDRGARMNISLALKDGQDPPRLEYGQRVELDAKVRRPRNYANPGAFDYVRYLARQQVYWTASASASAPIRMLGGRCGSRLAAAVFKMRVAALERIEHLYAGDEYSTAMMEAILIGESGKLEKVWTEHFRRTGTFHALVISGMHIVVLAGTLLFLLRICLVPEMTALAIAAAGAWVYAAVSGWSAPVVRAAGGFTLYLVGRYLYRRGRVLNLVAAIALVYLAWDPGQLFEASFQLSFLCVASIGAFASPLTERVLRRYREAGRYLPDIRRDMRCAPPAAEFRLELRLLIETIVLWTRIPARYLYPVFELAVRVGGWVAEMVLLSAVIQVALALPMALYFHRISITGLTANLAVVPLMNALVPVGFAAIFTGSAPLAALAKWLLIASKYAAAWHVRFEPAHRIPDPPAWLALGLTAALILVAVATRRKTRWIYAALTLALGLFAIMAVSPFPPEVSHGILELTAIDVGQGDGLMLTTPEGKVLLIDAGGLPAFGRKKKPSLDIGEDVISPYLWTRRIQHADVIATTHAHEDHVGGLKAVVDNFHPSEIWTGALPDPNIEADVLNAARASGIRVVNRKDGEAFDYGGARFEVLAPSVDHIADGKGLNNDSLVLSVRYGMHSFLLTGDMERPIEWGLLSKGVLTKTTVLKVAHHGSKTSSTTEFLDATQPEFAIISVGHLNLFRHPNPEVIERLEQHHADVLRTDVAGLVMIRTDGRHLTVTTMNRDGAEGQFIEPFQAW
jgi:competence protein ComEC